MAFARRADGEGFIQVAKLFRAGAEAETVHALNHFQTLGEVASTKENLATVVAGEIYEYTQMYRECLSTAKEEGNQQAVWSFTVANRVEQVHAKLLAKTSEQLENNKQLTQVDYYICSICGNTVEDAAPERCPMCGSPAAKFFRVA